MGNVAAGSPRDLIRAAMRAPYLERDEEHDLAVRWRDKLIETSAVVSPDHTAFIEVELGEPRAKTVTGTVRDIAGNTVEGARVTAVLHDRETATARSDASGHYTLQTHSGAQLVTGKADHVGRGNVGRANVTSEQIDLTLDDAGN